MTKKNIKKTKKTKTLRNKKRLKNRKSLTNRITLKNTKVSFVTQNNRNRTKKGGFYSFFKKGPSQEKTNEFVELFTRYMNGIIRLQKSNKPKIEKQKQLYDKINEIINYINTNTDNVDKNIRISNENFDIRGLPIYIVGRIVEKKTHRDMLIDSLKNKGFNYNTTSLNSIVDRAEQGRNKVTQPNVESQSEITEAELPVVEADSIVTEVKLPVKLPVKESTSEANPNNSELLKNILKQKKAREIEEKRIFDEEQKKMKQTIEDTKNRIKLAEETKKKELQKTSEINIAAIKKKQQQLQEPQPILKALPKIAPITVIPIQPTAAEINEEKQDMAQIKAAEDNDKNLLLLVDDQPNTRDIVIQDSPIEPQKNEEPLIEIQKAFPPPAVEQKLTEQPNTTTVTIIKHKPYDLNSLPQYWLKYFPPNMLYTLRDFMLYMLNNTSYLYQITDISFPALKISKQDNKYIDSLMNDKDIPLDKKDDYIIVYENKLQTHIRFILLYLGIMSNILLKYSHCYLVIKGGKAIQMNCSIPYESNDIDILIISKFDNVNKQEMALDVSKLLGWIVSQQNILNKMSIIEFDRLEQPLIKISILTKYGFQAIVDIGYNDPKDEIKSYYDTSSLSIIGNYLPFTYIMNGQRLIITYDIMFISQSLGQLIEEKIYFYIKYAILKKYTTEDNAEFFIPKIIKSLETLLTCTNINTSNEQIYRIVNKVKTEKEQYLKGIENIPTKKIVDELIMLINNYISKKQGKK
jgi:hypothetical protein